MAALWGTADGPWRKVPDAYRDSVMTSFQIYLRHDTYKVLDGPLPSSSDSRVMTFHVELEAPQWTRSQPFDVIKTKGGGGMMQVEHEAGTVRDVDDVRWLAARVWGGLNLDVERRKRGVSARGEQGVK